MLVQDVTCTSSSEVDISPKLMQQRSRSQLLLSSIFNHSWQHGTWPIQDILNGNDDSTMQSYGAMPFRNWSHDGTRDQLVMNQKVRKCFAYRTCHSKTIQQAYAGAYYTMQYKLVMFLFLFKRAHLCLGPGKRIPCFARCWPILFFALLLLKKKISGSVPAQQGRREPTDCLALVFFFFPVLLSPILLVVRKKSSARAPSQGLRPSAAAKALIVIFC